MDKHQKKQIKRYITWGCLALLVAILSIMPLLAGQQAEEDGPQASILSTTVAQRTIDSQIIGGGQLASEGAEEITIPEAVKLTKYLVGNGDTVKKGDPIARVDKVSVMLAMTEVQDTLDQLSGQIAASASDKESDRINAQTSGVVKLVYGKAGDSVRDVMLEHGALAVVSLDDKMAVQIECVTDLTYADEVTVTLPEGKQVDGFVESNISGLLLVTIEDKDYDIGQTVAVSTTDGIDLGSGTLDIHNPWNAAAYYGTIKKVNVKAGDKVSAGKALFQLEVGDHSTAFQLLIQQRQEYEELMQELFEMYDTGILTAPCDGFVTGVDKDGAFLLAAEPAEQSWFVQPLSHSSGDTGWTVTLLSERRPGWPGHNDPTESTEATEATEPTEPTDPTDPSEPVETIIYYEVTEVTESGVTLTKLNTQEEPLPLEGVTTYADGSAITKGDIVTLGQNNVIQKISGGSSAGGETPGTGDSGSLPGGMGSLGGFGGGSGIGGGSAQAFTPYSLETITVATVTSQEEMTLEIAVDEQDIASLSTGQEATITVEALTGQSFPAVITSISNTGTNAGGSSKFTVKLTLSKTGDMLPGMNASAYLPLQSQSAAAIPVAALVEKGAQTIVYTGYNEKEDILTDPVTVTTGVSDGEYVQILSGLAETDTVYYAYYDTPEYSRIPELGMGF